MMKKPLSRAAKDRTADLKASENDKALKAWFIQNRIIGPAVKRQVEIQKRQQKIAQGLKT